MTKDSFDQEIKDMDLDVHLGAEKFPKNKEDAFLYLRMSFKDAPHEGVNLNNELHNITILKGYNHTMATGLAIVMGKEDTLSQIFMEATFNYLINNPVETMRFISKLKDAVGEIYG